MPQLRICTSRFSNSGRKRSGGLEQSSTLIQRWIRVDDCSSPPLLFRPEFENREVQMRSCGISGRSDVSNDGSAFDSHAFTQIGSVAAQVRVEEAMLFRAVKLI